MTDNEFLDALLKSQDLADDSPELTALQDQRAKVEATPAGRFP